VILFRLNGIARVVLGLGIMSVGALACGADNADDAEPGPVEKVRAFDEYPLLWLGPTYDVNGDGDEDSLHSVDTSTDNRPTDLLGPEFHTFEMSYQDCSPQPCVEVLQLTFTAACGNPLPSSGSTEPGTIRVRGIDALIVSTGGLLIQTVQFNLWILAVGRDESGVLATSIEISDDLIGANTRAAQITTASDFLPPPPGTCGPR
jgi:hypothetical protein